MKILNTECCSRFTPSARLETKPVRRRSSRSSKLCYAQAKPRDAWRDTKRIQKATQSAPNPFQRTQVAQWSPLYSPQERESLQVNLGEGRKGRATVVRSTALPPKSVCNTLSEPLSRSVPLHTLGRRTAPAIQRPHVLGFSSASSNALPAKLLAAQRGGNLVIVTSKRFQLLYFAAAVWAWELWPNRSLGLPLDISSSKISARLLVAVRLYGLDYKNKMRNNTLHPAEAFKQ